MAILTYEELKESVENVARSLCRKANNLNIGYEDAVQELWVWMCIKKPENLAWARKQLVNRAIDILRGHISDDSGVYSTDFSNPISIIEIESNICKSINDDFDNDVINNILIESIIKTLEDMKLVREEKYVIAKIYLNTNIDNELINRKYKEIFDSLTDDKKETIDNYNKNMYTDDIIAKTFLGIKTGTNAGSMRSLKQNLKIIKDFIKIETE